MWSLQSQINAGWFQVDFFFPLFLLEPRIWKIINQTERKIFSPIIHVASQVHNGLKFSVWTITKKSAVSFAFRHDKKLWLFGSGYETGESGLEPYTGL